MLPIFSYFLRRPTEAFREEIKNNPQQGVIRIQSMLDSLGYRAKVFYQDMSTLGITSNSEMPQYALEKMSSICEVSRV